MERSATIEPQLRRPLVLAATAAAPFLVGRVAGGAVTGEGLVAPHVICPLRALTGVPCPLCGATRSVVLASHGDPAFLTFNPVWVVVLAALAVVSAVATLAAARGTPIPRGRVPARVWWWLGALVLAAGWTCSLLHRHAIVGA